MTLSVGGAADYGVGCCGMAYKGCPHCGKTIDAESPPTDTASEISTT